MSSGHSSGGAGVALSDLVAAGLCRLEVGAIGFLGLPLCCRLFRQIIVLHGLVPLSLFASPLFFSAFL
jgi:hypothetical protein